MTCTTEQQTNLLTKLSELTEHEETNIPKEVDAYDEKARQYRQYLAQQEALRQLDMRKTQALASSYRFSFFR